MSRISIFKDYTTSMGWLDDSRNSVKKYKNAGQFFARRSWLIFFIPLLELYLWFPKRTLCLIDDVISEGKQGGGNTLEQYIAAVIDRQGQTIGANGSALTGIDGRGREGGAAGIG
jgi:hypothetical protein